MSTIYEYLDGSHKMYIDLLTTTIYYNIDIILIN